MSTEGSKRGKKTKSAGEMSPELREVYEQLRKLEARAKAHDVLMKYRVGELVREVQGDEGKYGGHAVEMLSAKLGSGFKKDALYGAASVARTWGKSEFSELVRRGDAERPRLSFSHFVELARVKLPEKREQMFKRALKDGLSVRRLSALIDEGAGTTSEAGQSGAGCTRSSALTRSESAVIPAHRPCAALTELVSNLEHFLTRCDGLEDQLKPMVSAEPTEALVGVILNAMAKLAKARDLCSRNEELLAAELKHVQHALAVTDPKQEGDFRDVPKIDGTETPPAEAPHAMLEGV
ncbi:DUF1016 N-terminal domain-containing protein [Cystobacter ferrugineus]|uniref:DUF3102 domain-containing protein n=1 Tax=Cystobacter ferrugineus TaxID=83449 RepID=A0A1L9B7N1_9BACT|nr:DUF1016 family protein [Cystobacter ferrugineus]OJH38266.1 hypothetical protein BON30_24305 [Cystobacter ferrugineus]